MRHKNSRTQAQKSTGDIEVLQTEAVSPHNKAIYEAGKTILIDSVKIGRDFCQFMITTSTGAIPVYLAIIALLLPKNYAFDIVAGIIVAGPAICFLLAALIFALGFFPISDSFSLDLINEIEKARNHMIQRRRKLALLGFTIFTIATLYAIVVIIVNTGKR